MILPKIEVKYDGKLEIDELKTVKGEDSDGSKVDQKTLFPEIFTGCPKKMTG